MFDKVEADQSHSTKGSHYQMVIISAKILENLADIGGGLRM